MPHPFFDSGIEQAIRTSLEAHGGQTRKGSDLPYVSHPIHVAFSLVRLGCHTQMIQAGLLHDVVEDCEDWTLDRVRLEFDENVAQWVGELTEPKGLDWEARKQNAVERVGSMSNEAATIKAADKLHNLASLCLSLEQAEEPDAVWKHFSRGAQQTIEMSERLVLALVPRIPAKLADELRSVLSKLKTFG